MPSDFNFLPIIPELILAIGALALVLIGVFGGQRSTGLVTILSVVLLAAAGIAVVEIPDRYVAFSGAFTFDAFARLMKLLTLLGSAVAILMSVGHARAEKYDRFEFPLLIVIATLGMLLMISASDLIAVYLGLHQPTENCSPCFRLPVLSRELFV
jgi:NADH-quinone oxidoreductase subunit N